MEYFYVQPEVAGGLGALTVMDTTTHPPIVSKLHYHFDGWLGNVLLETFPCFIVTDGARQALQAIGATGANSTRLKSPCRNNSKSSTQTSNFRSSFG